MNNDDIIDSLHKTDNVFQSMPNTDKQYEYTYDDWLSDTLTGKLNNLSYNWDDIISGKKDVKDIPDYEWILSACKDLPHMITNCNGMDPIHDIMIQFYNKNYDFDEIGIFLLWDSKTNDLIITSDQTEFPYIHDNTFIKSYYDENDLYVKEIIDYMKDFPYVIINDVYLWKLKDDKDYKLSINWISNEWDDKSLPLSKQLDNIRKQYDSIINK